MTRIIITLIGASALAVLPVTAGNGATPPSAATLTQQPSLAAAGKSAKASTLLGMEVRNYQDEKIGKIVELAVDIESGRLVQIVLSSGGFAGIGDAIYTVPPNALRHDPAQKYIQMDATAAKLKGSPEFTMSQWDQSFDTASLSKAANYYGVAPPTNDRGNEGMRRTGNSATESLSAIPSPRTGQVQRATKVLGLPVRNLQADTLGEVNDLLVNLTSGRIVAVVISSGGFLGIRDEMTAVPPAALRFTPSQDKLQLDVTKESLASAPHFPATQWPDFDQPSYASQLEQSFVNDSYDRPAAPEQPDNTARNVRDRNDQALTPMDQGNGKVDLDISARIRKEIMASESLSTNGKNVKVITRDAHVTLRGPTNSAEEKRLIGEIADRIAGKGHVDNQLEVKSSSSASQ